MIGSSTDLLIVFKFVTALDSTFESNFKWRVFCLFAIILHNIIAVKPTSLRRSSWRSGSTFEIEMARLSVVVVSLQS